MAFSPPEYCGFFAQKKAYQGGSRAPPDPPPPPSPSYAPAEDVHYLSTKDTLHNGVYEYGYHLTV